MTFEEWKEKHNDLIENVAITFFYYGKGVDTKTCYDELEYLLKRAFKASRPKWHDLRKDPNDVPFQEKNEKWHIVLDNFGNKCFYDNIINKWRRLETLDIIEPTAWCELPKFEETDK